MPVRKFLKQIYTTLPLKKELFTFARFFWTPDERIYKHLHFKGVFKVQVDSAHSFRMRHYGFQVENEIFWEGLQAGYEKTSFAVWGTLVREAQVIFDIGANTGVYSLIAKSINPRARVYAFEPIRRIYEKLQANNGVNQYDITCLEKAVSNSDGVATIYDLRADHVYSVTVGKNLHPPQVEVIPTEIETTRLDTFIEAERVGRLDLMKIDVETHESEVLEGMGKYLDRYKPTMLIEILNDDVGARVEAAVRGKGYFYFNIDDKAGSIRRTDRIRKSDFYNYLLCTHEVARQLKLSCGSCDKAEIHYPKHIRGDDCSVEIRA